MPGLPVGPALMRPPQPRRNRMETKTKFDAIKNPYGYYVGRFAHDGKMIKCTNAFDAEYRAIAVAQRMAEANDRTTPRLW